MRYVLALSVRGVGAGFLYRVRINWAATFHLLEVEAANQSTTLVLFNFIAVCVFIYQNVLIRATNL